MPTSKEVFALHKAGELEEAYRMAIEINSYPSTDAWDIRALGWCLVDLIKRDYKNKNYNSLPEYAKRLEDIEADPIEDKLLYDHRKLALSRCDPLAKFYAQARELSEQKRYRDSIKIYHRLMPNLSDQAQLSYGWDLYHNMSYLLKQGSESSDLIKRMLKEYLLLKIEKPSILHSCILTVAVRLAKADKLNMAVFLRSWGIENFQRENYQRNAKKEGGEFPALAEDALQKAIKVALKEDDKEGLQYYMPFLEKFIKIFPDNIWFTYYLGKSYIKLGKYADGLKYCKSICKSKPNDFWTWALLADAFDQDKNAAMACYARALSCPGEPDKMLGAHAKAARLMAEMEFHSQCKHEICLCERIKPGFENKEISHLKREPWYAETELPESNRNFYAEWASKADDLLYEDLPWLNATLGASFIQPGKDGKPDKTRRKIYIAPLEEQNDDKNGLPIESVCKDGKTFKDLKPGAAIMVKGEYSIQAPAASRRFNILCLNTREGTPWDIFVSRSGVIIYRNEVKKLYRAVVAGPLEVLIPFNCASTALHSGDFIKAMVAKNAKGLIYAVKVDKAKDAPGEDIYMRFENENMEFIGEKFGFTESDIFISGELLKAHHIDHYEPVSGFASRSFDFKKSRWGWMAVSIYR